MSGPVPRLAVAAAYVAACRLEVRTLKPGNVHVFAAGHRMTVEDFDRSAEVSAPVIADPALPVGTRVRRAVEATFEAVAANTNLGIVLLSAPLAAAAGRGGDAGLEERLRAVLRGLDHEDAREVFKAIAHANPAGLGAESAGDVRSEPPAGWTLGDAMRAAAGRDMIAEEYASDFAGVFANARAYMADCASGASPEDALSALFLRDLTRRPDTHIIRKHGSKLADTVQALAARVLDELGPCEATALSTPANRARLMTLDTEIKSLGANPGSLADIACASVFAARLDVASRDAASA